MKIRFKKVKRFNIIIKRGGVEKEEVNIALRNQGVLNCTIYHKNIDKNEIVNLLSMGSLDVEKGEDARWSERPIDIGDVVEIRLFDDCICDEPKEVIQVKTNSGRVDRQGSAHDPEASA